MINSQSEKLSALTYKVNDLTSKIKSQAENCDSLKLRVSAIEDNMNTIDSFDISSTNSLISEVLDGQHRQKKVLVINIFESTSN